MPKKPFCQLFETDLNEVLDFEGSWGPLLFKDAHGKFISVFFGFGALPFL